MKQLLSCIVLSFVLLASRARAEEARSISTTGEAVVYVAPDEVVLSVGIETYAVQLDQAKAANDEAATKLLKAVKAMGIEDKHLQAANMEIELRYKDNRHLTDIEGFNARRSYTITLKDTKKLDVLIDTTLKNGANRMFGVEYRTTELRKHRDAARKMAIKAAKEKAVDLAGELQCKVGSPRNIGEGSIGYYGYSSNRAAYGNAYMSQNSVQMVGGGGEGGETMPLGQIGIRASISVVFDLVP